MRQKFLHFQHGLELIVHNQNHGGTDSTENVGTSTLEEGTSSFFLEDLAEAVNSSLVNPLFFGLLGLHLQTAANGIEGVGGIASGDSGDLGDGEFGSKRHDAGFFLVRVVIAQGVVHAKIDSTVRDDASDRDPESIVETQGATGTRGSLLQAIKQAVEITLAAADI